MLPQPVRANGIQGCISQLSAPAHSPVQLMSGHPTSLHWGPAWVGSSHLGGQIVGAAGALLCSRELVKRRQADRESSDAEKRLEMIQAAIRRGEAKAAQGAEVAEPRRMTPEEEEVLGKMFIQPEEMMEAQDEASEPQEDLHEVRIRRTLEFCPDGVLAWEILQEITASGEKPGVGAYDLVIEAFSRRGALDDALAVFKAVSDAGLQHSDASFDLLATPASKSGEYRFVERLFAAKAQAQPEGEIGPASLALLLDAYANGLPSQAQKAQAAFRSAMAVGESAKTPPEETAPGQVLRALKRAVGPSVYRDLTKEYGLDPDAVEDV
ncbi:unnamed protein product [Cladocopium goreaui]|uniref:Pentatricopeptide repeat-containing protein n=1 Tax=Cladocopium goreaui TaxID=2562237 RepID=A0A9P1BJI1_9DINO|nr:unnamed protein product [Cladocopium goreaui]